MSYTLTRKRQTLRVHKWGVAHHSHGSSTYNSKPLSYRPNYEEFFREIGTEAKGTRKINKTVIWPH